MYTLQLGSRIEADLVKRLKLAAEKTGRTERACVESCLRQFLPVLESGLFGTPLWDDLRSRWDADLAEAVAKFDSVRRGAPSARASARKAAA